MYDRARKLLIAALLALPIALTTALGHALGLTKGAPYHTLQNDVIVAVMRRLLSGSFFMPPTSITSSQTMGGDPYAPVKGKHWIARYTSPAPGDNAVRDAVLGAVESLMDNKTDANLTYAPETVAVEAEWTAYRKEGGLQPNLSDKEVYNKITQGTTSPTTVLYFHGGGYYFLDPVSHRPTTSKLAKITGGKVYSVRYRLVPQHAFPSALVDALMSYLTLLYPPPGAYHEAVQPEHIVFAGDSAGGHLSVCLLQLILELRRSGTTVKWHGERREIPVPAAVATNSPWLDIGLNLVELGDHRKTGFDILRSPQPRTNWIASIKDEAGIWPPTRPRLNIVAEDHLMAHPLVSLITAKDWTGAPPMYLCTGWEVLATEDKFFAQKLNRLGVPVVFEEYEGMPHCFAMVIKAPENERCMNGWAGFIKKAVEQPKSIKTSATLIRAKTLKEEPLQFEALSTISDGVATKVVKKNASIIMTSKL